VAALLRAAHLTEDGNPKIFQDTLAHTLVGHELAVLFTDVLRQSWPPEILPVARVTMVTRARYTEDHLFQRYHGGEPWLTFFHPAEFEALVRASGFTSVEHFGPEEAVAQPYFHNRTDHLRPQGLERYVAARC
jgi:O-methyltransferase involved in polyketide biosynthesis